jgi:hypothetical protein
MRCGNASGLGQPDPDSEDVCLVAVAFTNHGPGAETFSGTADQPGPTWRLVGYDAQAGEFHGHVPLAAPTPAGASGTTELVFDVPKGLRLNRVLIGDAMVDLTGAG